MRFIPIGNGCNIALEFNNGFAVSIAKHDISNGLEVSFYTTEFKQKDKRRKLTGFKTDYLSDDELAEVLYQIKNLQK